MNLTIHDFLETGEKVPFCGGSRKGVSRVANSLGFPKKKKKKKTKKSIYEKHLHLTSSRIDLLTLCLFGSLVASVDVEMEISQEEERPKDLVSSENV